MSLSPGQKLAHYEIIAAIGKGGMGEVYRARDTKLDRYVAIKVLPDELAQDEERFARFEREAKLLAALNHPGVATLHGLERIGAQPLRGRGAVTGDPYCRVFCGLPRREGTAFRLVRSLVPTIRGQLGICRVGL